MARRIPAPHLRDWCLPSLRDARSRGRGRSRTLTDTGGTARRSLRRAQTLAGGSRSTGRAAPRRGGAGVITAQLVASAHALANAPLGVVGPGPVIDAALGAPQLERGEVSGVVMTSVASGAGSCGESFFYSDPGTGAPPKVEVKRSGDCGTGTPAITGGNRQCFRRLRRPAKSAAPYRGIGGGEEFAAGRKGAAPRGADQISASRVTGTAPAPLQAPNPLSPNLV